MRPSAFWHITKETLHHLAAAAIVAAPFIVVAPTTVMMWLQCIGFAIGLYVLLEAVIGIIRYQHVIVETNIIKANDPRSVEYIVPDAPARRALRLPQIHLWRKRAA